MKRQTLPTRNLKTKRLEVGVRDVGKMVLKGNNNTKKVKRNFIRFAITN